MDGNDTRKTSYEVSNEGEVEISSLTTENYNVGDKAQVLLNPLFEEKNIVAR
jgi:hypothetical protein